jgi:methyltransferase (TIGR00027 family)
VKPHRASRTAGFVAAARAYGAYLPEPSRLVDDPYGEAFVWPPLPAWMARAMLPLSRRWILYMQVRTRAIDDDVRAFVRAGARQLVVLGAGYDSRALRMAELANARVFEIDHPATQAHKREVLAARGVASPARYVEWDFEARAMSELPDALAAAGLDRAAPTFTIWEGVTMYLSEPAIDASLRAIRAWSAAGSELGVTYFSRARLQRQELATRAIRAVVRRLGEPWTFGWDPAELPAYLAERGFAIAADRAMGEAARDLLPRADAARVLTHDQRYALARVVAA